MPEWIFGLLRLQGLDTKSPFVRFDFAVPVALWHWPLLAGCALSAAWWCYRKSDVGAGQRLVMVLLRAMLLMLLVFLLLGPRLSRSSEVVESDTVAVLIDRSASLAIADAPGGAGSVGGSAAGKRESREQQLRTTLAAAAKSFATTAEGRKIVFLGFDAAASDLAAGPTGVPKLGEPVGVRTDLDAALVTAMARAAGRPLAGIVVLSDGRLSEPVSRATLRKLEASRVGIFPVPLGSPDPAEDIAVRSAESPGIAFVSDTVPIRVELTRAGGLRVGGNGAGGGGAARSVNVELVDPATGTVMDTRTVEFAGATGGGPGAVETASATLVGIATTPGKRTWVVRAKTEAADLIAENDTRTVELDFTDRPLRVLYVDGYPRWEYRYLKNLLAREKSVEFAALLLSPGRRYIQEGTNAVDGAPTSKEEWDAYDVIIMGDVKPEVFSGEQIEQLRKRVTEGGAGLLWIAGTSAVPDAWRSTRLVDLLPFASPPGKAMVMWDQDVTMRPTLLADRLNVLRLADPVGASAELRGSGADGGVSGAGNGAGGGFGEFWNPAVSDPASGWSRLRWAQRIERNSLKPAAEVLAEAAPAVTTDANPSALVSTMRFGSGRIIYVATDEIWRYRYGRGEDLTERFWLQLVRLLGREASARAGRPALLEALPSRGTVGQPVSFTLTLLDQALIEAAPARIAMKLAERRTGEGAAAGGEGDGLAVVDLVATTEPGVGANAASGGRRVFTGTWLPQASGTVTASVVDPGLAARGAIATEVVVTSPDDELRRPEADHAALAELAQATGGTMISPANLAKWQELVPKREIRQTSVAEVRTLWDTPLALMLVVLLLSVEWSLRRLLRMV